MFERTETYVFPVPHVFVFLRNCKCESSHARCVPLCRGECKACSQPASRSPPLPEHVLDCKHGPALGRAVCTRATLTPVCRCRCSPGGYFTRIMLNACRAWPQKCLKDAPVNFQLNQGCYPLPLLALVSHKIMAFFFVLPLSDLR
jgi:hypothetical protein